MISPRITVSPLLSHLKRSMIDGLDIVTTAPKKSRMDWNELDFVRLNEIGLYRIELGLIKLDHNELDLVRLESIRLTVIRLNWTNLYCIGLGWMRLD